MEELKGLKNIPKEWKACKNSAERKKLIKKLWKDYQSLFWYVVFGIGTTLTNILVYTLCYHVFDLDIVWSNILAWIFAVLFAYLTNRSWVFHSTHHTLKEVAIEVFNFFIARGATGLLDLGIMVVSVNLLNWQDMVMKVISNIIVIILNYIASKLWIFGNKTEHAVTKHKKS